MGFRKVPFPRSPVRWPSIPRRQIGALEAAAAAAGRAAAALKTPKAVRRVSLDMGAPLELVAEAHVELAAGVDVLLRALALGRDPAVVELVGQVDALDRDRELVGD